MSAGACAQHGLRYASELIFYLGLIGEWKFKSGIAFLDNV